MLPSLRRRRYWADMLIIKAIVKILVGTIFTLIVGLALLLAVFSSDEFGDKMPEDASASGSDARGFPAPTKRAQNQNDEGGEPLPAPAPFDDQSRVVAQSARNWSSGTGFAIADNSIWLTAKHVAQGCNRLGILNDVGRIAVKARAIYISDTADIAIFKTEGGPGPLTLDLDESDMKVGARGFHIGYPQGKPGEVTSRLIGRELMITEGAWRGKEDTLAWAETGRTPGLNGTLGGLSGGPAFDGAGKVVGITIAENPRRGRVITTAARSIAIALNEANISANGTIFEPLNVADFSAQAKSLRADLKIVQVICLTDG